MGIRQGQAGFVMCLVQLSDLSLSALPGTEGGITPSFHLITPVVPKARSSQGPGGKEAKREGKNEKMEGSPPFLGPLVLFSAMVSTPS